MYQQAVLALQPTLKLHTVDNGNSVRIRGSEHAISVTEVQAIFEKACQELE